MTYRVLCHSTAPDWIDKHHGKIGSSDAAALLGVSPWCSRLELYARLIGAVERPEIGDLEHIQIGLALEAPIGEMLAERLEMDLVPWGDLLESTAHPWAIATPDWRTPDGEPVEIKTVGTAALGKWSEGDIPPQYACQVQHQCLVTGADQGIIAALTAAPAFRLVWGWVPRDEAVIDEIRRAGDDMMRRVAEEDPPPPDDSESASAAITALYPETEVEEFAALSGEAVAWDERLEVVKAESKALDAEKRELTNKIKAAIGPAAGGVLPNGVSYKASRYTVAAKVIERNEFSVFKLTRRGA